MRSPAALLISVALAGCAHPRGEEGAGIDRRAAAADFRNHTAELGAVLAELPACAAGQEALSVAQARKGDYTPGACLSIEGQLVVDAEPRPCDVPCAAQWYLLGGPAPPPPVLPGVPRYVEGPDALPLRRDFEFAAPRRECERDDAGRPRLENGRRFLLPNVYRERRRGPGEMDLPSARVVLSGQVHDHCRDFPHDRYGARLCEDVHASRVHLEDPFSWLDIERICRRDLSPSTSAAPRQP